MILLLLAACTPDRGKASPAGDSAAIPVDTAESPPDGGETGAAPDTAADTADAADPCPGAAPFAELAAWNPDAPLCDIPKGYVEGGGDPANPPCAVAYGGASDRDRLDVPDTLRVVSWNVRFGMDQAGVLEALAAEPELAAADFLLLQEVARRDLESDPAGIDQAAEIAAALGMHFAFATEWDRREDEEKQGEHGVAVLSKYPLGHASLLRLPELNDWWEEDAVYGGRVALGVDARVGCDLVRLYTVHLDTRGWLDEGRAEQGAAVRADADASATARQIAGGDLNTWLCNPLIADCEQAPDAEQVVEDFLSAGWTDATAGFGGYTQLGEGFFPQRLDWIFWRGPLAGSGWSVLQGVAASDHYPMVWTFSLAD